MQQRRKRLCTDHEIRLFNMALPLSPAAPRVPRPLAGDSSMRRKLACRLDSESIRNCPEVDRFVAGLRTIEGFRPFHHCSLR